MKINRKGFTLIELLGVIVILSLVVWFATYGVINALNNSKEQASIISESSIMAAATTFSTEKNDDNDRWIDVSGSDSKYFCTTVEELINNGLLDKNAKFKDDNIDKYSYIAIKKNKVTFTTSIPIILTDTSSDDYTICSGNIKNEDIISYPTLGSSSPYTDTLEVNFTDGKAESAIKDRTCEYGYYPGQVLGKGTVSNGKCIFEGLRDNSTYYVRVCMTTEKNSYICSNSESRKTLKVQGSTFSTNEDKINIEYDNTGIKGEGGYYFSIPMSGTSASGVKKCTIVEDESTSQDAFSRHKYIINCSDETTNTIEADTWYKSDTITPVITVTEGNGGQLETYTYDKSGNYIHNYDNIYSRGITFSKGEADTIDGKAEDIYKTCVSTDYSCNITSPSIEKEGYTIVGWGLSGSTTSSWDPKTSKSVNGDYIYYPIFKNRVNIQLSVNGGNLTSVTGGNNKAYYWKTDSSGIIYKSTDYGQKYDKNFFYMNNGATLGGDGLPNYNNAEYINITRDGYTVINDSEWICLSGCSTSNKVFSQSKAYKSSEFCDASSNSCTVVLGVNWQDAYKISYDANGGSGAPKSQTKEKDKNITLSGTKPTRSGYTFLYWNTKKDGSGDSYMSGGTYIDNESVTLYAQWRDNKQTLTYNNNGGSGCTSKKVTKGSAYGYLCTPTRSGYTFVGWFDANYKDSPLNYYADNNSDVYAYFKYDASLLYKHYLTYGKSENRRISQYISTDIFNEAGDKTIYAGWIKFFILESITPLEQVDYATVATFTYAPYVCRSSLGINTSNCTIQVRSSDCAIKSSAGATTNCLSSDEWHDISGVTINAYYYTSNSNVSSATASTNNSRHCIDYRAVGTDSSGNYIASDNYITSCYTIVR